MKTIDLSQTFQTGMPQYPGQPAASFEQVANVLIDGYQMTKVNSVTHVGTHCDSPSHFVYEGLSSDNVPLDRWMGHATVVNLSADPVTCIEPEHLQKFEIQQNQGVLIGTGHCQNWGDETYYTQSPYLSRETALYLRNAGIKFVGLDFGSPDPVGSQEEICHRILLEAGILIIENLCNVHMLSEKVWFCAAPIKILHGDGGFCRAFAIE